MIDFGSSSSGPWEDPKEGGLIPRNTYLVLTDEVGMTPDVAWYEGQRDDGNDWWIMANTNLIGHQNHRICRNLYV